MPGHKEDEDVARDIASGESPGPSESDAGVKTEATTQILPEPRREILPEAEPEDTGLEADASLLNVLANVVSPLLVPTFATLAIFWFSILSIVAPGAVLPYALTVAGATGVVPLLSLFVLKRIGSISSYYMYERNERIVPYIVMTLALGAMTVFYVVKGATPWIWTIYCGATAACLLNFCINFRLRVSTRCSAAAALLAALIVINTYGLPQVPLFWWAIGVIFFAGLAGTAAVFGGRHSIWEVIAGYATGFLPVILFSLIR